MTLYELIRASLLKDAEKHPYPLKGCEPAPPEDGEKREESDKQTDPQRREGQPVRPVAERTTLCLTGAKTEER